MESGEGLSGKGPEALGFEGGVSFPPVKHTLGWGPAEQLGSVLKDFSAAGVAVGAGGLRRKGTWAG